MEKQFPLNVTGLWINETKDGKKYMAGTWGQIKVLIFKNEKKEKGSKQPDYFFSLAQAEKPKAEKGDAFEGDNF